ncbi:hypothetical protein C1645_815266 [Glomus cerebriforme]|uniref:Uncharacterized protein n=1 Tax=Glomus cerebriforme TaxID=658196 RepID=A0A397TJE9_9GLOM|nr:hypothetical protein C1645_815266 [Glomus cerebriforme]
MPENQNDINICDKFKNKNLDDTLKPLNPIDIEIEIILKLPLHDSSSDNIKPNILKPLKPTYITLVYFNQFQLLQKKLEEAISIPFILEDISNYSHIEEEILLHNLLIIRILRKNRNRINLLLNFFNGKSKPL